MGKDNSCFFVYLGDGNNALQIRVIQISPPTRRGLGDRFLRPVRPPEPPYPTMDFWISSLLDLDPSS